MVDFVEGATLASESHVLACNDEYLTQTPAPSISESLCCDTLVSAGLLLS